MLKGVAVDQTCVLGQCCDVPLVPVQPHDNEQEFLQRRFSGGSQSYGGESPRLSPCSSMGKLSKSEEQLSSLEQDSGQCSRNTSCETLGRTRPQDDEWTGWSLSTFKSIITTTSEIGPVQYPVCHC